MGERAEIERVVAGGAGLGRLSDGRVAIVKGALPGETAVVAVEREAKRHIEGSAVSIENPSRHRVSPPCPHAPDEGAPANDSCGGCDWQHIDTAQATEFRRAIVVDALRRIGKIAEPDVVTGPSLGVEGYRTIVRAAVDPAGVPGFRKAGSHDPVDLDSCLVAHPLAAEILLDGRFPGASEIEIKVGARTGERLVSVTPSTAVAAAQAPDGVIVVGQGGDGAIVESVAGNDYRISAGSFFQCRPDGADALIDLVREACGSSLDQPGRRLLDAYGGVGLFGVALGEGHHVVSVESNPSSCADAEVNLDRAGTASFQVVRSNMERWKPQSMDVVIADPARKGLGPKGVGVLAATGAETLVLVSCDPAALGRDARLLIDAGFTLDGVTTLDLFGHTSHVEAVSRFHR